MQRLSEYAKKRDFKKSPEPKKKKPAGKKNIFVVQEHAARHLHFDLRISIDGVLVSWAVPKGIPKKTMEKRLAVRTEDHPLEYAAFEGKIPKGEYGAGTVSIWDNGTYKNYTMGKTHRIIPIERALKDGRIDFFLKGNRVKGNFLLIKTKYLESGKSWLLIKKKKIDWEREA